MVLKNFTIIRFIPLLYGIIWDNVFLVEGFSRHILAKKVTKTMAYRSSPRKALISEMILRLPTANKTGGALLSDMAIMSGCSEIGVRRVICELRNSIFLNPSKWTCETIGGNGKYGSKTDVRYAYSFYDVEAK